MWWLALLPGNFTIDSVDVVRQIQSGTWNDWHTNAYTTYAWLASFGGRAWSFITFSQVVLMAIGIASLGNALHRVVRSPTTVMIASAIFASLPQVGSFTVTMWKDVPSAAGEFMMAAALIESRFTNSRRTYLLAASGALLIAAFRWNGPVALTLLCVVLAVLGRPRNLRMVAVLALVTVFGAASLMLPQQLKVSEATSWFNFEVRELHDLAYAYRSRPEIFDTEDLALLESVMPLSEWRTGGSSCEGVEVLQYKSFSRFAPESFDTAKQRRGELSSLWRRTLVRAPVEVATVRLCRAGGVLSPIFFGQQPTLGLWNIGSTEPELVRAGYFPTVAAVLTTLVGVTDSSELSKSIFLNAMLWTILVSIVARINEKWSGVIWTCLPVGLCVMMSVALGANAHDARYVAGALLVPQYLLLISGVVWLSTFRRDPLTERA